MRRILFAAVLTVLVWAPSAQAAIALQDSAAVAMFAGSPYTVALSISANGYVFFSAADSNHSGQVISTVTAGAVNLALLCTQDDPNSAHVELWGGKTGATSGSVTVTVTYSAQSRSALGEAISYTGVNQTTPVGSCVNTSGLSTSASLSISVGGGEWAVGAFETGSAVNFTSTAGNSRINLNGGGIQTSAIADSTSATLSYSLSGSSEWAAVGVALKPEGGGGTIRHRSNQSYLITPPWRWLLQRMLS